MEGGDQSVVELNLNGEEDLHSNEGRLLLSHCN